MKKYVACLLAAGIIFVVQPLTANMAAPYDRGGSLSSPFTAKHVEVTAQKIIIEVEPEFRGAGFDVLYSIKSDTTGLQIPMLFHAPQYAGEMKIEVNGEPVETQHASENEAEIRARFAEAGDGVEGEPVRIYWSGEHYTYVYLSDLVYFELDLDEGEHEIRVNYRATPWVDYHQPVKSYHIRYSLYPVRYWKSFAELNVVIDTQQFDGTVRTNLDEFDTAGFSGDFRSWQFDDLPGDYISVSWNPGASAFASWLIRHGFWPVSLVLLLLFAGFHLLTIRVSAGMHRVIYEICFWGGLLLVPFLITLIPQFATSFIDAQIGQHASRRGMFIVLIMGYPLVLAVYGLALWAVRRWWINPPPGKKAIPVTP